MTVSLLDAVSSLLRDRKRSITYENITAATGVGTPKLSRLARGKARGMPTEDVQAVYEFLADKPLIGD